MSTPEIIIIILVSLLFAIAIAILLVLLLKKPQNMDKEAEKILVSLSEGLRETRIELNNSFQTVLKTLGDTINETQDKNAKTQMEKVELLTNQLSKDFVGFKTQVKETIDLQEKREQEFNTGFLEALKETKDKTEQRLEQIRSTLQDSIAKLQNENTKKLDEMRNVVDEKLQKTLEERLAKSFGLVSQQLDAVHKGLGDMQQLAVGVGDLKKVLSNVKTRGSLGEIQLGSILEQLLSPEQYDKNVVTKKGTSNPVEYAIKFPGEIGRAHV